MISLSVLLRRKNVSDKSCKENQNTRSMISKFFSPENRAIYEIMWKNMVEPDTPQMTIQYGAIAISCWITKATNAHP
jgi:hypothetical protein